MPTRTHSSDPFAPRGSLTREQLLAYAERRLSSTEQHEVEMHLQADPLLRDAAEGLQQSGASAALRDLDRKRPSVAGRSAWWLGAAAVGIAVAAFLLLDPSSNEERVAEAPPNSAPTMISMIPLATAEIETATEQPESLRIGHEQVALHNSGTAQAVERESGIERVHPRSQHLDTSLSPAELRRLRAPKISRQLLFLHDLKLVHPQELYASDPLMTLADSHVAARYTDDRAQDSLRSETITLAYTAFMDDALGRFAENDHKGCLDDLRFLLAQYPDDVNALFYGGLCAYNLGMYDRARTLLHRAATHPVDVFNEEAAWYHALTLARLGDEAAPDAFTRIAENGGFYAEQAREHMATTGR